MQRNFLRGLLICLIPCLLAAMFALRPDKYRLGIDLAGGTILVYEVNLERTKIRKEIEQGEPADAVKVDLNQLAAQIKRRIDPTDIKNVTVRPSGDRRIEIILPTGGAAGGRANLSQEDIEEAKRLISQMGVLEFRILANGPDDEKGILAAQDVIRAAAANKNKEWVDPRKALEAKKQGVAPEREAATDLQVRAAGGLPPPHPLQDFAVDINETKALVRYAWVELGKEERESLGLTNAMNFGGQPTPLWKTLEERRDQAVPISGRSVSDVINADMVLYSRECVNAEILAQEDETFRRLKDEQARGIGTGAGKSDEQIEALVNRKLVEYFVLTRVSDSDTLRVGDDITLTATSGQDSSFNPAVDFVFNGAGAAQFGKITRRNKPSGGVKRHLAILLDEKIVSAPGLESEITSHGQIHGKFDRKSVDRLVQILRSGALSAELREKPVSENTIGPTLGADTIKRGTFAIGAAFIAVLAFMVIYYRFAGFVACVALFANLLLTVGFMVAVNAAFTLPGLAGLVLTLGIAVDANVLIYERLREERNKGANLATAIRNGYDRAFATIIDTHLTAIFTAIVLYVLGNDQLKGFAISLTVGLVISLFTSLYMTRLMFDYWQHKRWLTNLKMMRLFEKPNFRPMNYRYVFFSITAGLTLAGLALFMIRGDNGLNVDFRGGTVFAGRLSDGEERGLTTTADGKLGFRELLSPQRQAERLKVASVYWENRPVGDAPVNVWEYTITYEDGERKPVTLTEQPRGATPDEMADDVKARAGELPNVSVEQMFLTNESYDMGKSKRFTVRTTEKQQALVQAALDRLMRTDDGKVTLLDTATMTIEPVTGSRVDIAFNKPTSLAFTRELISREFRNRFQTETTPDTFTLTGVGEPVDGRYMRMQVDVSGNQTLKMIGATPDTPGFDPAQQARQLASLQAVMNNTKQTFDSTPEPERLEVFDSVLAAETRQRALVAILVSWLAIILYLWFRFGNWTFGLAAVICLIHDLCLTLGIIALSHYLSGITIFQYLGIQDFKIDLAAVAALLTLIGYSVSDTIVVFDRIREVRGKNPRLTPSMIDESVNQTLSRTILTSMTVFLVSFVLYALGGEGVHLFAFVMVIGVLVGTYSSIFVAAPLLLFFGEGRDHAVAAAEPESSDKEEGAEEEVVEG